MSLKQMILAFDTETGNPINKLILLKLADQANDDGFCWPSYASLAKAAEVDRSTAIRHLRLLVNDGFLKIEKRFRDDGSQTSNMYHLTLAAESQGGVAACNQVVAQRHRGSGTAPPLEPIIEPIIEPVNPLPLEAPLRTNGQNYRQAFPESDHFQHFQQVEQVIDDITRQFNFRHISSFFDFVESKTGMSLSLDNSALQQWRAVQNHLQRCKADDTDLEKVFEWAIRNFKAPIGAPRWFVESTWPKIMAAFKAEYEEPLTPEQEAVIREARGY